MFKFEKMLAKRKKGDIILCSKMIIKNENEDTVSNIIT